MKSGPFRGRSAAEISARIDDLCECDMDKQIARLRIINRMKWSDIGAEVGCDRRTASRHFNDIVNLI